RGRVRRRRVAAALALFDALDRVARLGESGAMLVGRLTVVDLELVALLLDDLGGERLAGMVRKRGLKRPVLLRLERKDLALAVHDEPERDRLDAAGGESIPDLLPEEARHRVADEPVHDAPRLLRVHEVLVDIARVLEGLLDRGRSDLVEGDAPKLGLRDLDEVGEVPGDGLAFAVEVGGEPDMVGGLRLAAERSGVLLRI